VSANKLNLSPLPDLGDVIFILLLQLLLFNVPNFVFGDGSTGWHLVTGNYILQTHSVPHQDILSYTFPGKAWVAYEWLSDAIMAGIDRLAGLNGVAVFCSSLIALTFLLVYERCRWVGCHFGFVVPIVVLGAIASSVHWLARPHLFTFLGIYIFAVTLESFHRGTISEKRMLLTLVPCMLLWVNLHPGFVLGFVLLFIYLFSETAGALCYPPGTERLGYRNRRKWLSICLAATLAASLITPYGVQLYGYIGRYLMGNRVLAATDEYASPVFHGALQPVCLELLFALLIISLVTSKARPSLPHLLSCLAFGLLALSSQRSIPFFVIVASPLIAYLLGQSELLPKVEEEEKKAEKTRWLTRWLKSWSSLGQSYDLMEYRCKMHLVPMAAVGVLFIVAINGGNMFGSRVLASSFDQKSKPSLTLDYIRDHKLSPERGFNYDNWGGYIRYRLGIPVFIDDRADFYGQGFYLDYGRVSTVAPGWLDLLKQYKIEWVLFPRDSALAARLMEQPDWQKVCEDPAAYLFVKHGSSG